MTSVTEVLLKRVFIVMLALFGSSLGLACQETPEPRPQEGDAQLEPAAPEVGEPPQAQADEGELVALSQQLLKELGDISLSFAAGGAEGPQEYGLGTCRTERSGGISLTSAGAYSAAPSIDFEQYWWGKKFPTCDLLPHLKWGDMVYFLAEGFMEGESVQFTIDGPGGSESHRSRVERVIDVRSRMQGLCKRQRLAARFNWAISPKLGLGNYRLTVSGSVGSASMTLEVHAPEHPNYGAQFGVDGHPLLLTSGEKPQLVFAGFPPNHTVPVQLLENNLSVTDLSLDGISETNESKLLRRFGVRVNRQGWAVVDLDWPAQLEKGLYSFHVPGVGGNEDEANGYQGWGAGPEGSAYRTIQFVARRDVEAGQYVLQPGPGYRQDQLFVERLPVTNPRFYRVVDVEPTDTLNVRSEPLVADNVKHELDFDAMYIGVKERRELAGRSPWFQISCGEFNGWVNSRFLAPQD